MLENHNKAGQGPVGLAAHERRAHPRYAFSAGAEVTDMSSGARVNARISDLGRGGCYVDSMSPFPSGSGVKIQIVKDEHTFTAEAKVVYAKPGMGMGLMFAVIEPDQRWVLEKWLAELRGETPSEPAGVKCESHPRSAPEARDGNSEGNPEQAYVLNELIIALMRKRVLTDAEGKALLQKLLR